MSALLVSVLVTSYNHARYVEEALDSLRAQTSTDFEVIITDDASSDGTAEVIEAWLTRTRYPARFIRNLHNRGICRNRNAALALAAGRFVCSLSGDDVYEPERIEQQLARFRQEPERVAAIYGDALVIDAEGRETSPSFLAIHLGDEPPPQLDALFRRLLRGGNFICGPATMVRRSAIDAVGGYDETLVYEDYDMWLRLSQRFDFVHMPGRLVRYRVLPLSFSHDPARRRSMRASEERILEKMLRAIPDPDERQVALDGLELRWSGLLPTVAPPESVVVADVRADGAPRLGVRGCLLRLVDGCGAVRTLGRVYRRVRDRLGPA